MSRMAKCGLYKYSFCTHKHDACECANCLLVKRHGKLYKYVEGRKYKKCPHCGEYKPLSAFKILSNGSISWCMKCMTEYSREHHNKTKHIYTVSYKKDNKQMNMTLNSLPKAIKCAREVLEQNNKSVIITFVK